MPPPSDLPNADDLTPVIGSRAGTRRCGGQYGGFPRRGLGNDAAPARVETCGARGAGMAQCPFAQPAHPRRQRGRVWNRGVSGKRVLFWRMTARDRGQIDALSGPGAGYVGDVGRKG